MQMPPTDATWDKSESQRREEGRKEARMEGSGRPLSPEASEQPSSHCTSSHTNTPASARSATHRAVLKRKAYAHDCVKRSDYITCKATPCNVFAIMRRDPLWTRWIEWECAGQGFPLAVFLRVDMSSPTTPHKLLCVDSAFHWSPGSPPLIRKGCLFPWTCVLWHHLYWITVFHFLHLSCGTHCLLFCHVIS